MATQTQLTVVTDTIIKSPSIRPVRQGIHYPPSHRAVLPAGTYSIRWIRADEASHSLVAFQDARFTEDRSASLFNWLIFNGHIAGYTPPSPTNLLAASRDSTALIPGTSNFRWGEVTRDGTRPLPSEAHARRAVEAAKALQEIRDVLGSPLIITSWYRPPEVNQAVGGVPDSRHILGDGVDFYSPNHSTFTLYTTADRIIGNRGGVFDYPGHVHIDTRGHRARW